jgi:hypothetical protein
MDLGSKGMAWNNDQPEKRMACGMAQIVTHPKRVWELDTREVTLIDA